MKNLMHDSLSAATPLRALLTTVALFGMLSAAATAPAADAPATAPKAAPMRGDGGAAAPAAQQQAPASQKVSGEVLETMDAANYTYVKVKTPSGDLWAAGPKTTVKVGDTIAFDRGVPMTNFASKSLGRTFDSIDFVGRFTVAGAGGGAAGGAGDGEDAASAPAASTAPPHAGVNKAAETSVDLKGIAKAKGGNTVAEVFDQRATLSGKEVTVRGKVVKSNPQVMGHNWLHVRDGSKGADGSDDLTLTTKDTAKVGDTIVVKGKVVTDKDFGFGYHYDVMLEEASVTVE